jgi:hypothetical protein
MSDPTCDVPPDPVSWVCCWTLLIHRTSVLSWSCLGCSSLVKCGWVSSLLSSHLGIVSQGSLFLGQTWHMTLLTVTFPCFFCAQVRVSEGDSRSPESSLHFSTSLLYIVSRIIYFLVHLLVRPPVYQSAWSLHRTGDAHAHSSSVIIISFIPTLFLNNRHG